MPELIVEKETCDKCGVDVRENTLFCYNCGSRVAVETGDEVPIPAPVANGNESDVDAETRAALADLAEKFKIDDPEDDRLARAAAERRRARVSNRKNVQYTWEPEDDDSNRLLILVALLITALVSLSVFLTVLWR